MSSLAGMFRLAPLALVALVVTGCSHGPDLPDPGSRPGGVDFAGLWYSPQFEHMYLRQDGDEVTGIYTYQTGGRLTGTVEGDLLTFEWNEPGSKETAVRQMSGHGFLQIDRRNGEIKLVGEWGYREDYRGAGPWEAEYVRALEADDPTTLDDLRTDAD